MPFVYREDINTQHRWGIWEIAENEAELLNICELNTSELSYLLRIKHPKKRLEHLAGRAAAKCLIRLHGMKQPTIINNHAGRPQVLNHDIEISISHSNKYAAAIVSNECKVGIDIQLIEEKLRVVAPRILSYSELKCAKSSLEHLSVYWGAKEALYKLTQKEGIDLSEHLAVKDFDYQGKGNFIGGIVLANHEAEHKLFYTQFNQEYMVVLNLPAN